MVRYRKLGRVELKRDSSGKNRAASMKRWWASNTWTRAPMVRFDCAAITITITWCCMRRRKQGFGAPVSCWRTRRSSSR